MKLNKKNSGKLNYLKYLLLLFFVVSLAAVTACKTKQPKFEKGGSIIIADEGWLNDETYRMTVYGQWDRSRYYVEGEAEESGKTAKPLFGLREDAKIAAKVKAMRNFKEKIGAYIASESRVENSTLISDVVDSTLNGVIIAPESVKEIYSARHDASILFYFKAKGLKNIVDKAIQETLEKK